MRTGQQDFASVNHPGDAIEITSLPWPGDELAFRVAGGTDREHFYRSGRQSVEDFERMLALVGTSLADYRTILDFGCGCGRIMLWLRDLVGGHELHGVDIDERAIAWATEHLPWATFKVNQPLPPLDYPDGFFDLVVNHSVFTHIDEEYQDKWLAELRRVTKPGGHLLLSVHGETAFRAFEDGLRAADRDPYPAREQLARAGIVHVRDDNFVGGPFPDFYHSTFHSPWYVHEHWSQFFTVAAYAVRRALGFQDLVLLQRDGQAAAADAGPAPRRRQEHRPAHRPEPFGDGGLDEVRARLDAGPDVHSAARHPRLAAPVRRLVLRALRHYGDYQRGVDEALLRAIRRLDPDASKRDSQLWQALRVQGERVNRLEADLWEAIKRIDPGPPPGGVDR